MRFRLKPIHLTAFHVVSLLALAVFFALSASIDAAGFPRAIIVENHGDVLVHWLKTGVRGAVIVNVDAHDDCTPIPPEYAGKLRRLLAAGDTAAISRANSASDSGLYDIASFIPAACALGIAREDVWVAPLVLTPGLLDKGTGFRIRTCPLESLPEIQGPVLLTVDADIVPSFANHRCIDVVEAVRRIGSMLRSAHWDVVHASVCFSVDGGFLPVTLRWVGNALQEALDGKDLARPKAPWVLLDTVENWRRGLMPREVAVRVKPLVLRRPADPWLRVYLADALFRSGDVPGALTQGLKAARLDPGCCRILPELGGQLAGAGRMDEAERFLASAPAVVNISAELSLAQALDRAGRTDRAIKHLTRISGQVANYSAELLIGFGYERLGDTARARRRYLRAAGLLETELREMPEFPDIAPAVAAAERFLRSTGNQRQALALRRDPRLVNFFSDNKETGGSGGR